MGILKTVSTASLVLAAVVGISAAATAGGTREEPEGCMSDAKKLCAGVKVGGIRVLECLARKKDQLSAKCQTEIEPAAPHILGWRDACGADIDSKCADEFVGLGLIQCLDENKRKLAPECRVKLASSQAYIGLACAGQVANLCKGTKPGDGRYLACIDRNGATLAPPCDGVWKWYEQAYRTACTSDIKTHCGGKMAYDQSYPCLQKNLRRVSRACRRVVEPPSKPLPQSTPLGEGPFAGRYTTNWGFAVCRQTDASSQVSCDYTYDSGKLTCVANKRTLACSWREAGNRGRATFVRNQDGHLRGTWGHGQSATDGGRWVFVRLER